MALPPSTKSGDTLLLELPFFDDFADYEGLADSKRWLFSQAFVNKDYAPLPPSVGMITLDALDADGNLYPHASTNPFKADTLVSQRIRLDSITGSYAKALTPADSVILSFYYIPGGWYGNTWELVGDAPSSQDSLFLDLYDATNSRWSTVWATPGGYADTSGRQSRWPWLYASVKIDSAKYFSKYFQFRFRNYASLDANPKSGIAGNCDQWNIDYIYLNRGRTVADSFYRDIAFLEKAPSMLTHYQAMPAIQYRPSDMAANLQIKIANRYNQTLASTYSYHVEDLSGQTIANYDGGFENVPAFFPNGTLQSMPLHASPAVSFNFPQSTQHAAYTITHVVREGVGGDNHNENDTIVFRQTLSNYYAYDDGIPENGYGLTSQSSKMWLACRYDLRVPDTLTALQLFFNRTRNNENSMILFHICIWNCRNGLPNELIYKDAEKMKPAFDGMNTFHRYNLTTPLVVNDTIFVGIEQLSNDYINIGFDRSNDSRRFTYYRTGNEWMQSILKGSLMMRPLFGTTPSPLSVDTPAPLGKHFRIYPNPASDVIHIVHTEFDSPGDNACVTITDSRGAMMMRQTGTSAIDIARLSMGMYFVRITDNATGHTEVHKLIITR